MHPSYYPAIPCSRSPYRPHPVNRGLRMLERSGYSTGAVVKYGAGGFKTTERVTRDAYQLHQASTIFSLATRKITRYDQLQVRIVNSITSCKPRIDDLIRYETTPNRHGWPGTKQRPACLARPFQRPTPACCLEPNHHQEYITLPTYRSFHHSFYSCNRPISTCLPVLIHDY